VKKALIVGIDNYPTAPLSGCVNDANSMANVLEVNGDGSPNFSVRLLTASTNQLLKRQLKQQVEELFSGDNETSLFYFAGHGCLTPIGGYIVTSDGASYDEGISMNEILMYANKSKAKNKIIILDCCHSGALGKLPDIQEDRSLLGLGLIVLTACRDSETSAEIGGRGVFTSLVEDALQGGAADLRGFVTPGSIYSYVDQALGPWDQRPIFKSNVTAFTSLRKINPPLATEELRKICTLFTNPSEEYLLDPSYEDTDPSAVPENCDKFKILQKYNRVNLVVPVGEDHMYYAAMNSKSCRLTAMGYQYWRLVNEKKL
jgi:uncharacterized caspase-like protein